MEFSLGYLDDILPPNQPPAERIPELVRAAYVADERPGATLRRRSAFWTYAIFSELREGEARGVWRWPESGRLNVWTRGDRRTGFAVGAFDPDHEGPGFGIAIIDPSLEKSEIVGEFEFPRLGRSFRFAVLALAEEPHMLPTTGNAASACWAEDVARPGHWGVLTCRHALARLRNGASVALSAGLKGTIAKAPATIDAAFIDCAGTAPASAPLSYCRFPAAGLAVDVQTSPGPQSRTVISTTDSLGVIDDPLHPIKVYIDKPCQPGDSGALVADGAGTGVGIYSGALANARYGGSGQIVGFSQHLEQAAKILNITPYL